MLTPAGWAALAVAAIAVLARAAVAAGRRRPPPPVTPARPSPANQAGTPRWRIPPAWFRAALDDAGVDVAPERLWPAWPAAGAVATVVSVAVLGPGGGVVAVAAAVAAPAAARRTLRGRGDARYETALAPALEAVARSLRSGAGLAESLQEAAATAPRRLRADVERVVADAGRGSTVTAALDAWAQRRPVRSVQLAVAALALGLEAGGAQARAVDGVAATMRQRSRARAEAAALASQARLSAAVIAAAPVAFAVLAAALDPGTARFLFRSVPGAALLCAGLALDLVGAVWMARLAKGAA